jgi:hypothetical protein
MSDHPFSQLAREIYSRFGRNDFQGVLELVTDDIEATIIPFGQTFKGKEGFLQFMHGFKDAFPDMEIKIDNQVIGEARRSTRSPRLSSIAVPCKRRLVLCHPLARQ